MSLNVIAVLGIVILLVLLFLGVNIGIAMLLVGFLGYAVVTNWSAAIGVLASVPATQASTYSLTVIPLFVLMGNFCYATGMSSGLYNAADKCLSRAPGGLADTTIVTSALFGAICGSTQATAATIGVIAIPEMRKYGYDDSLSCGSVSVGGTLGIMIPPSTPMIVYGLLSMESIGQLFAAGILPGILEAVLCIVLITIWVKTKPGTASPARKYTAKERLKALVGFIPMLILFVAVFGGMFSGIFTINESAAVGAFLGFIMMFVMRKFTWKNFMSVMKDTVKTTSMTFLILIGAVVFGNFLTVTNMPSALATWISSLNVSRYLIFALIVVIYFFLGMLMDALPMMMLTVPIFLPIIKALGFDAIWFGVVIVMVMQLGLITPPVGMSCYVVSGIAKDVPLMKIFKGALPFCLPILASIVIITMFPAITTILPNIIYG